MFYDWSLITQVLVLLLISLPVLAIIHFGHGPVERRRLARFARRHEVPITVDNGPAIIRYLRVTRRWRCAGLIFGYLGTVVWHLPFGNGYTPHFLALLAGWFVGALAAELRMAITPRSARRVAAIRRREPRQYMRPLGWWLLAAATALSAAMAGWSGYLALTRPGVDQLAAVLWFVAALATLAVVTLARRQVLLRPQPAQPDDQRDADNAIRSRSVHVLTGVGVALVLYAVLGQLSSILPALGTSAAVDIGLMTGAFGTLVVPGIGWALATERWPISRMAPPDPPAVLA